MSYILYVAIGGLIGSVFRYLVGLATIRLVGTSGVPLGTLLGNLAGCFAIGFLSHLADNGGLSSPAMRTFLFAGFLGGFTTFSTFANETSILFGDGAPALGVSNILLNVGGGLLAVWIGRVLGVLVIR